MGARKPLSLYVFVVVLVRRGFRYLVVRGDRDGDEASRWYLPAGVVLPKESLVEAACRKVRESAGIEVDVTGLLSIEHMPFLPGWDFARWRFVLEGRLKAEGPTVPNVSESEGRRADFLMPNEVEELELRSQDALTLIRRHARGGPVAPIDLIYQLGV